MTLDPDTFKASNVLKDGTLGTALVAATAVIAATEGSETTVAVAGVIVAGAVLVSAVLGRFLVRRGGVNAAGLVAATTDATEASAALDDRPDELTELVEAFMAERDGGRGMSASIESLPEDDSEAI